MRKSEYRYVIVILMSFIVILGIVLSMRVYDKLHEQEINEKEEEKPTTPFEPVTTKPIVTEPAEKDKDTNKILYRIFYYVENVDANGEKFISFYDFQINDDYDILSVKKKLNYKNMDSYTIVVDGQQILYLSKLMEELRTSKHTKTMNLNVNQKEVLKEMLSSVKYEIDFGDMAVEKVGNKYYFITNYQENKAFGLTVDVANAPISNMVYAIANGDMKFFG